MLRRIRIPRVDPAAESPLEMGDPAGAADAIRVTDRFVERDGSAWFPVMAEYHFSRDRPERWERELRKIRSGGVGVVATYVLWILHEEVRGTVRWDGARDLRRFVETAAEVGLEVVVRVGPWAHGETRNGGFPDWLQELPIAHRTDDPAYLDLVRSWYGAIAEQLDGLFRDARHPHAPIVGVQIENELYDQPGHLSTLRRIAEEAGMRAPLWTATGWGGAQLPAGRLLPVYAGYSDGFWEESTTGWPGFGRMHFTFDTVRDDLSVGADLRDAPVDGEAADAADDPWPFATCELGGGMHVAYHRRPHVDSADVSALALTKIGSGSAWQGYYLFHGATQVVGDLSTTQESQATGYPNDVPVKDYDFFAPVGAEGQQRPHFHALRRQHLMLQAFGDAIASCPAFIGPSAPDGPAGGRGEGDVRWSVRSDGERGFLFVNNHQPAVAALSDVADVQFAVRLPEREIVVPSEPFALASGVHAVWPLRQRLGSFDAVTATAQPITQFAGPRGPVVLMAATPGAPVELHVEGVAAEEVRGARVRTDAGRAVLVPDAEPGLGCEISVRDTTFVVLDADTADAVWRGDIDGRDSVAIWRGEGWFDGGFRIVAPDEDAVVDVFPPLSAAGRPAEGSVFARYAVPGERVRTELVPPEFADRVVAPVRAGGPAGRLSAPDDADFAALEPASLSIPDEAFDGVDGLILRLDWTGDALRVFAGDALIADQFWSGRPFELDLVPHRAAIRAGGLSLRAFAWSPQAGVHVDPRHRPRGAEPQLDVRSATLRAVRTRLLR